MNWAIAIGLACAAFTALVLAFRLPRWTWSALGATLMLGLAGYAMQAAPGIPGAPKEAVQATAKEGPLLVEARKRFSDSNVPDNYLIVADAFTRQGDFANAAEALRTAVRKNPDNSEAWLAMANALAAHAEGNLSPAALYAYGRAEAAAPSAAAPDFFKGVAMLRSGKLIEAHKLWSRALAKTPPDAPWRADLQLRVRGLEELLRRIAEQIK
jgi:cytochrome c-type biogenesis protein CcmH